MSEKNPVIAAYHNPSHDLVLEQGHKFVENELGLHPIPKESTALMDSRMAGNSWGSIKGGFSTENNAAIIIVDNDPTRPESSRIANVSRVVHELTHSATANESEHAFYSEALAGIGEKKYFEWLNAHGEYRAACHWILESAGVRLFIPATWRYTQQAEADVPVPPNQSKSNTSQGLIAALGLAYSLKKVESPVTIFLQQVASAERSNTD